MTKFALMDAQATNPSLLLRLQDPRNGAAWTTFQVVYEPLIFRFCKSKGLQEADARDVTQDVLRAVCQAIATFSYDPSRGTFRSWMYQVTRSKLCDYFKHRERDSVGSGRTAMLRLFTAIPDEEATRSEWDCEAERRVFEWACEQVMPLMKAQTWSAFWSTSIENRPPTEVAEQLGMSIGAVYIARSRVIGRIRARVAEVSEYDAQ